MENKGLLDKIQFIMQIAKKGIYTNSEFETLMEYTNQHTDNAVIGRVFGYSVSDYALACLKWINTEESNVIYKSKISQLSENRKEEIEELIKTNRFLEFQI